MVNLAEELEDKGRGKTRAVGSHSGVLLGLGHKPGRRAICTVAGPLLSKRYQSLFLEYVRSSTFPPRPT